MNWSKLSNNIVYNVCFYLFFITVASAQNKLTDYKKTYPSYNELILNDSKSYDLYIENHKLKVIEDNNYESMILSENGIQNNRESFSYSELVKLRNYDAYTTLINSNGKEKKIKVTNSNEKQSTNNSVFFDDVKERQLIFPSLEAGAKKTYNVQNEFVDPFLLHKFIFGGSFPVENSSLEIKTEKDINIGYKIFNDPNNTIAFSKTEKKGKWVYKWSLKNIKPLESEPNSQGYLYIIPHINFYVKDYTVDNKKIEVLDDIDKLFKYYKGFITNLNTKEDTNLKALTEKITANQTNDVDKIKQIFYWVKDNIKYIAFENGYEGFIPREASVVFERKFGDCKDMASIITTMAKYANVKDVNVSWIGTRSIPYSYKELSTPAVDNHMIAVFKNGDQYVFLDATDKETRYGIPTAFIQGKEAMFSDNDNYKIVPVPVVEAETNQIKETVKISINKDKLEGSGKIEFNGYNRSHILAQIGDAANKTRFEMVKNLVVKGNNKFNLKDYTEENIAERDKSYIVKYNFELENYIIKVDKEIYVNLFLDKIFEKSTVEKDRVSKFEFDYLTAVNNQYEFEIPKNCTIKHLPENLNIDNELLKANFTFEIKNKSIQLNIQLKQKKMVLDNKDFELWNQTIHTLEKNYTETIILLEK